MIGFEIPGRKSFEKKPKATRTRVGFEIHGRGVPEAKRSGPDQIGFEVPYEGRIYYPAWGNENKGDKKNGL